MKPPRASQARVFKWILAQKREIRAREVADAFGITICASTAVLGRIRNRGGLTRIGFSHKATWIVCDPRVDMGKLSGMHPNSLRNLRIRWKRTTGNSHPKTKQNKDWAGATELEKCWGLTTISMDTNAD